MRVWSLLKSLNSLRSDRKMGLIAAGVAFYGMFSIFPGLAALIALFGLVADPVVVQEQAQVLSEIMPPGAWRILNNQLSALLLARTDALGWASLVSLAIAVWSARAAVSAMMQGLNEIFDVPDRSGLRHILVALVLTMSLIGVAIVAMLLIVVLPVVLTFLPLGWAPTVLESEIARWALVLAVMLAALGMLYRYGPNRSGERLGWITPGAIVALGLWLAASWGFSTYLTNFGNYNEVYGSIGAVAALLMWFYISAYLALIGAGLNAVLVLAEPKPAGQG